jgi:hypothetical protein
MSNEITQKPIQPPAVDGYATFDPTPETSDNNEVRAGSRMLGVIIKFTNDARWILSGDGDDITGRELLPLNIRRTEVKWGEHGPLETRELAPGERYRDLKAVNATVPQSEWRMGPSGNLEGPWARQHVVEFIDLTDMACFSWPVGTIGGEMCINDLRDRVMRMRQFRGPGIFPLVTLSDTFMRTRFGGRQRPHLEIKKWVRAGEGGEVEPIGATVPPTLSPPTAAAAPTPAPAAPVPATAPATPAVTLQPVSEPTRAEELNDHVPW